MEHDHDHHRMDDDGGPTPEVRTNRIGVRLGGGDGPIVPSGYPGIVKVDPASLLGLDPEPPAWSSWKRFAAFRGGKCPNRATDEAGALDEIGHAIHEFVGECAELAELISTYDSVEEALADPKLIDECGDIYFCGNWVIEAWGLRTDEPADSGDVEIVAPEIAAEFLAIYQATLAVGQMATSGFVAALLVQMLANAGLLCNAYKKLRYQGRPQDTQAQSERIIQVFTLANLLLVLAGSNVGAALQKNVTKLSARYPTGFEVGGGVRTGEGS